MNETEQIKSDQLKTLDTGLHESGEKASLKKKI